MSINQGHRLIILAGPSCVGKSPLFHALKKHFPEFSRLLKPLVLYNSRAPRPKEVDGVDYHFRNRIEIEKLEEQGVELFDVRGDLQGLDTKGLFEDLKYQTMLFEGNPFVGKALLELSGIHSLPIQSFFMSPLNLEEWISMHRLYKSEEVKKMVTAIMSQKLLRRTIKQKGQLSGEDHEEIQRRASSAYDEIALAPLFSRVIPNHDGEDSEHWNLLPFPVGEARKSLLAFVAGCRGEDHSFLEKWDPSFVEQA